MNREGLGARQDREGDWGTVEQDAVTNRVIGLAIKVHRALGPGLLDKGLPRAGDFPRRHAG